jgi:acetolactate synthase-1/2/3 large subunit
MAAVGATPGRNAAALFDVADPALDWVALARGHGVEAVRVDRAEAFAAALAAALTRPGPFLIAAALA